MRHVLPRPGTPRGEHDSEGHEAGCPSGGSWKKAGCRGLHLCPRLTRKGRWLGVSLAGHGSEGGTALHPSLRAWQDEGQGGLSVRAVVPRHRNSPVARVRPVATAVPVWVGHSGATWKRSFHDRQSIRRGMSDLRARPVVHVGADGSESQVTRRTSGARWKPRAHPWSARQGGKEER